jgi:hypothetical protein
MAAGEGAGDARLMRFGGEDGGFVLLRSARLGTSEEGRAHLHRTGPLGQSRGDAAGDVGTAFLDAGAGSVIGALWRIEDASAAPFLTAVHAALRQGVRPSEALRRARQELAAHGSADADAFGWGAFLVRGSDEALPPRTRAKRTRVPGGSWIVFGAGGLAISWVIASRLRRRS